MNRDKDLDLKRRAQAVMPNGVYGHQSTVLLPASYPQFFSKAQGAYIWDSDDNKYLDFMCAYGPNLLGYSDPRVNKAAIEQLSLGDTMTGPSPLMVELAEVMVGMVSHADWAIFCKNGTDATTMAKTVARAQTGKRTILVADGSYHGSAPWSTPIPSGVIEEDRAHIITYDYNNIESLEAAAAAAADDLAGVFATPFKHDAFTHQMDPTPEYTKRARQVCDDSRALLIVDDVRAGFRMTKDCSWQAYRVRPDLSTWGKSFANGHPISALLGSDKAREGAGSIYATGSFWFSAAPMAAALATLKILQDTDYIAHLVALGTHLRAGLEAAAKDAGFKLHQSGPVQMPLFLFDDDPDFRIGFAWCEAMLSQGVYVHPWHNMFLCAAMTLSDIDFTIEASRHAFKQIRERGDRLEPHPIVAAMFPVAAE